MAFKLRFVQRFESRHREEFMQLEKKFVELEQSAPDFPKGRRYTPYCGREPLNTLIWECDFPTLEEAQSALSFLEQDERHTVLYREQVVYFLESYAEIYKPLE
jgi:hypothetical protein